MKTKTNWIHASFILISENIYNSDPDHKWGTYDLLNQENVEHPNFTGILGKIHTGQTDLSPGYWVKGGNRAKFMDFSLPVTHDRFWIVVSPENSIFADYTLFLKVGTFLFKFIYCKQWHYSNSAH